MDLTGKVCVVTGASSGLGRRTARDLVTAGATVCAVARREDRLDAFVSELHGRKHSFFVADVSVEADVRALAAHVKDTHARCDVLINNAGFSGEVPFMGVEAARHTENMMRTNFFGALYCTAELLPLLTGSAPSHVINVASVAGRLAVRGSSAYSASKFALVGWSESLHFELLERGIIVTLIEPGPVPTEGFPQTALARDRFARWVLTSEETVSKAIQECIGDHKVQRVVPRWYYLLQFPRIIAPRVFWAAQGKILGMRDRRAKRSPGAPDE